MNHTVILIRRHDDHIECNSFEPPTYNLWLHLASVFIVMLVSCLGCGLAAASNRLKMPKVLIGMGRHFGTGVILSTAFIHMLMGAVSNLQSECSPTHAYSSLAPLIALAAALGMHVVEYFLTGGAGCKGHHHISAEDSRKMTTYIMEMGILSHSVLIGLSLGVAAGHEFVTLLVAIGFHQFFEGLGLGARIAELTFKSSWKPFWMVFMFSITTPLGVVLGIALHSIYDPTSSTSLIVQGTLDAIAAGILIYTGLVELVGRELSAGSEFSTEKKPTQAIFLASLYLGVATMAIVGIWV
ncbi:hypothetical protein DSO57_1019309 [Entomophthora muscae]|uniref:Uncharacterized protein n=1 Tax=Entomophthora muscae TaxID=34485 RepID=A0ACC2RV32_9FUNG|nr:hypothetical protein DSO57_1019309 [Entomophthora muscae]